MRWQMEIQANQKDATMNQAARLAKKHKKTPECAAKTAHIKRNRSMRNHPALPDGPGGSFFKICVIIKT